MPVWRLLPGTSLRERARRSTPVDACFSSRSYSEPFALVAWHQHSVGVDIERIGPLPAGFGDSIATPSERLALAGELGDPWLVTALWSGKEALAKALGDALAYDPRRLESPLLWADHGSGPRVAGGLRAELLSVPRGHVAWLCWRVP